MDNRCVICGIYIPEGQGMVCSECEKKKQMYQPDIDDASKFVLDVASSMYKTSKLCYSPKIFFIDSAVPRLFVIAKNKRKAKKRFWKTYSCLPIAKIKETSAEEMREYISKHPGTPWLFDA